MDPTLDDEHCAANFLFNHECVEEHDGYCRLVLHRHCRRNRHLYDTPDTTQVYERVDLRKVDSTLEHFQQRLPPRNDLVYHLELVGDDDRWQDLRQRVLADDQGRWPFADHRPFRVMGVQAGVCICTNTSQNRAAIRSVTEQHYGHYYQTIEENETC